MKAFWVVFIALIFIAIVKIVYDDAFIGTDGLITNATANVSVNGTDTGQGTFLLLFWQALPWMIGLFLTIAIFRGIGGRLGKKPEDRGD